MKTSWSLPLILVTLLAFTSCKKKSKTDLDNPNPTGTTGTTGATGSTGSTGATGSTGSTGVVKVVKTKVDPGIYLVGYKSMVDFPIDPRAVMWKDNNPIVLSTIPSYATAMCVQDTNIYVAGVEYPSLFSSNAVYWVNKLIIRLTFNSNLGTDAAVGIGVVGKDLYVAGNNGVYWKNGDMMPLPGVGPKATGMVIKGNDVYISGSVYVESPAPHAAACYWKNGVLYSTDDNVNESGATAIAVNDNGDVYLSGYSIGTAIPRKGGNHRPVFWKNNVLAALPIDKISATANSIAVDGDNVFVSGTADDGVNSKLELINPRGVLWKNGTPEYLGNSLAGGALTVAQGDVYVAGSRPIDPLTAYGIVLKNGAIISQGSITSFNNIYVIK